jgi:hypothetical protein
VKTTTTTTTTTYSSNVTSAADKLELNSINKLMRNRSTTKKKNCGGCYFFVKLIWVWTNRTGVVGGVSS